MTELELEDLLNDCAGLWIATDQALIEKLRKLSEEAINLLTSRVKDGDGPFHRHLVDLCLGELGYRWHLNRARELGSSCYCLPHACDAKDCAHLHGDD